jgi:hypothetical protein
MDTKSKVVNSKETYESARNEYLEECRANEVDPDPSLLEVPFFNGTAKSIRDAILQSVSTTNPTAVTDVFNRVRQMGIESHEVSIRNEISKLKNQGSLTQVGHGTYLRTDVVPPKKKETVKNAS